jgi:redox-sensitive bicupin YhaK (pirin superfamily)
MTLKLQAASERGRYKNAWLDSRHTFSFGEFHDPSKLGYSDLRVLNQDRVAPGHGFGMHRHRDMEIVSWILEGKLRHEDSMGHVSVAGPGGVQRLTAGSGMAHGEFNDSQLEGVHFLQIWILPRHEGVPASYEAKQYSNEALSAAWVCIASPEGGEATRIDQDARIFVTRLKAGLERGMPLPPKRRAWVHLALGSATLNGLALAAGDGVICEDEKVLNFKAEKDSEMVVFDLN